VPSGCLGRGFRGSSTPGTEPRPRTTPDRPPKSSALEPTKLHSSSASITTGRTFGGRSGVVRGLGSVPGVDEPLKPRPRHPTARAMARIPKPLGPQPADQILGDLRDRARSSGRRRTAGHTPGTGTRRCPNGEPVRTTWVAPHRGHGGIGGRGGVASDIPIPYGNPDSWATTRPA